MQIEKQQKHQDHEGCFKTRQQKNAYMRMVHELELRRWEFVGNKSHFEMLSEDAQGHVRLQCSGYVYTQGSSKAN